MTFLILVIIVLGWIIFSKNETIKYREKEREKEIYIKQIRDKAYSYDRQFLNNVLKVKSVYRKLKKIKNSNFEVDYFREFNDTYSKTELEVCFKYSQTSIYVSLFAYSHECWCDISKGVFSESQKLEFENNEDDGVTIDNILYFMNRIIEQNKLQNGK